MKYHNIIKSIQMELKGDALICENNTIRLKQVTRVWVGTTPVAPMSFWQRLRQKEIQKESQGVHLECSSGTIYSFITSDLELLIEAYDMLSNSIIRMEETIEPVAEQNPEPEPERLSVQSPKPVRADNPVHSGIEDELVQLKQYYLENVPEDVEIMEYVEQAIEKNSASDKEGLRQVFGAFIKCGIVAVCNELGLSHLIEIIKQELYS